MEEVLGKGTSPVVTDKGHNSLPHSVYYIIFIGKEIIHTNTPCTFIALMVDFPHGKVFFDININVHFLMLFYP